VGFARITSLLLGALIPLAVIFFYYSAQWRDLPDPPRHLKWKQRQRLADALRQTNPQIVFMSIWDGVADAALFADEIKAAFEDGGWTVDVEDRHLTGDLEHEYGLWV
jgi:hypothetical protein